MTDEAAVVEARSGAQAVERAIAILSCFGPDVDDLGLSELASRAGLRVSTAHRIARALVRGGLLAQDVRTDRYHLGRQFAVLGQVAMGHLGLSEVRPLLDDLSAATGEASSLGVREGGDVVVVLRAESTHPLRFDRPPGSRVPLHVSAMGKTLLAFSGVPPKAAVASLASLARYTTRTITRRAVLVDELERIRAKGFAMNRQERHDGVSSLGAPVLDSDGVARAAVAVQGPSSRFTRARTVELADHVMAAAKLVAAAMPLRRL